MFTNTYRRKMAVMAVKKSLSSAANSLGVNIKTVKLWRDRLLCGEGFNGKQAPSITQLENEKIKLFLNENGLQSLIDIKTKVLPDRSIATIYKIVLKLNHPISTPNFISYHCGRCHQNINALQIYYGKPRNPPCPKCRKRLEYIGSQSLRFIGNMDSSFILKNAALLKPTRKDIKLIEEKLGIPKTPFPLYYQGEDKIRSLQFHIVRRREDRLLISLCGLNFIKTGPLVSAVESPVDRALVCLECSLLANEMLSRNISLKPAIMPIVVSKKIKMINTVSIGLLLGNVSAVCLGLGISRTTFYNYVHRLDLSHRLKRR